MPEILQLTGAESVRAFYFTDLQHRAVRCDATLQPDATLRVVLPPFPAAVHVQVAVRPYGRVWATADQGGAGYEESATLPLIPELAISRIRRYERRAMSLNLEYPPDEDIEAAWDLYDLGRPMESLYHGLLAGEDLELAAAEVALETRDFQAQPPARISATLFGERLDPYAIGVGQDWPHESLMPNFLRPRDRWDLAAQLCDATTLPTFWRWVEFAQGRQRWSPIEEILAFCEERRISAKSFSLFWGGIGGMPPWFRSLPYPGKLKAIEKWTTDVVGRLRGRIEAWEIVNEMHDWGFANQIPQLTHEQSLEMTRLVSGLVGSLDPGVPRVVNHCCPWGDYIQKPGSSGPWIPLTYLEELCASGIEFEGIGVQMYNPGRDLMECVEHVDRFARFGKAIWITEMGTPSSAAPRGKVETSQIDLSIGWRGPWEQENQAEWVERWYTMALSRPYIRSLNYWDFDDERAFIEHAGLLDVAGRPKESYLRLIEWCERYHVGGRARTVAG
ncbi:MAG: endo-1,4-beta-xylanase [Planctomycetes bacterium]|nr:endo-1,4-beta-xylanase [Planctomycetota bacterium]